MKRDGLLPGVMLVLMGLGFLLLQLFPEFWSWFSWPWILIAIGVAFAIGSLLSRTGGLMIPAFIVAGLGLIFLYQTATDNWASWAYMWALMPAFVGVGMLVGSLYDADLRRGRSGALVLIVISAAIFGIFGGWLGVDSDILRFWPALLILAGAVIMVRTLLPSNQKSS